MGSKAPKKLSGITLDLEKLDFEPDENIDNSSVADVSCFSDNEGETYLNTMVPSNTQETNIRYMSYPHLKHLIYPRELQKGYLPFPPLTNRPKFLEDVDSGTYSDHLSQELSISEPQNSYIENMDNDKQDDGEQDDDQDYSNGSLEYSGDDDFLSSTIDEDKLLASDDDKDIYSDNIDDDDDDYDFEKVPQISLPPSKPSSFFPRIVVDGNKRTVINTVSAHENITLDSEKETDGRTYRKKEHLGNKQKVEKKSENIENKKPEMKVRIERIHEQLKKKDRAMKKKEQPNKYSEKQHDRKNKQVVIQVARKINRKRTRWNAVYIPDDHTEKVFLEDIGFIPSDNENQSLQFKIPKTVDKDKQNQEQDTFKQPLPPVKRPPTRIKIGTPSPENKTLEATFTPDKSNTPPILENDATINLDTWNAPKEDDQISITAPTLASAQLTKDRPNNIGLVSKPLPLTDKVGNWLQNTELVDEEWESISMLWEKRQQSNQKEPEETNEKISFADVPSLFGGLCYYKFFFGSCNKQSACVRRHFVNKMAFTKRCKKCCPPENVVKAYRFTLKTINLYKEVHICFIRAFGYFKKHVELVKCVGDLLRFQDHVNLFDAIEEVIKGLEDSGMAFLEAIDRLLRSYGIFSVPLLVDVLLEIISSKPNFRENWEFIRRCCIEKGDISPGIVRSILIMCSKSRFDFSLWQDVYNVVVRDNTTDLSKLDKKIFEPFRRLDNVISDSSANREVKNSNKLVASPNPHLRRSNRTQPVFEQRPPVVELPLHIEHGRRTFEALNGIEALQRHAPVINRLAVGKPVNFTEMLPKYMQNHTQKPLIFEPPVHTFQPSPTHFELPNQSVPPLSTLLPNQIEPYGLEKVASAPTAESITHTLQKRPEAFPSKRIMEDLYSLDNIGLPSTTVNMQSVQRLPEPLPSQQIRKNPSGFDKVVPSLSLGEIQKPVHRGTDSFLPNQSDLYGLDKIGSSHIAENVPQKMPGKHNTFLPNQSDVFGLEKVGSSHTTQSIPQNRQRKPEQEVNLYPSEPIIGVNMFNSNHKHSLHHLIPIVSESRRIKMEDMTKLEQAVATVDGEQLVKQLEMYHKMETAYHFTTVLLEKLDSFRNNMTEQFFKLLDAIGLAKRDYHKNRYFKGILEVLAFNMVMILHRNGNSRDCVQILKRFKDWDSLNTALNLHRITKIRLSEMGRYLVFAKALVFGGEILLGFQILECPALHLLETPELWPYSKHNPDMEMRDKTLNVIFEYHYKKYLCSVLTVYKKILEKINIYNYDIDKKFNIMLESLILKNDTQSLRILLVDIELFYKIMDKHVLRALYISMNEYMDRDMKLALYELCGEKGIYTLYNGNEPVIVIRNNMVNEEIEYIFLYYFQKVVRREYPRKGQLKIDFKLSDPEVPSTSSFQFPVRSQEEINKAITRILLKDYDIQVHNHKSFWIIEELSIINFWKTHHL